MLLKKNKKYVVLFIFILIIVIFYFVCSYLGWIFFTKGFGTIDIVLLEIVGNSLIVGIVTYFSTKFISEYLQEKDFNRNNIIEIEHEKTSYKIVNYEMFLNAYLNNEINFHMDLKNKDI